MVEDCDALLIVGSTFPYVEYYPKPGQARVVQIDRDPQRIGLRQATEAGLVGDARAVLDAAAAAAAAQAGSRLPRDGAGGDAALARDPAGRRDGPRLPMNPAAPVAALGARMPADAVVVCR